MITPLPTYPSSPIVRLARPPFFTITRQASLLFDKRVQSAAASANAFRRSIGLGVTTPASFLTMDGLYFVALNTFSRSGLPWVDTLRHKKTVLGGFTIRQNDETAVGRLTSIIPQAGT